ncbi:hypothetical protein K439DRAFT_1640118 [Ramaria rubella]|nr:hypothetical protein K439DRAFT_1640118 [Ramaria rubella]
MSLTTSVIEECFKPPKISARLVGGSDYLSWARETRALFVSNDVWKCFDPSNACLTPPSDPAALSLL